MPLIIVALGILALLFLIMGLKLNTFISLLVVSFGVALALGMPFDKVVSSIEAGIGGTLGHIALIFGLGAMLGKLIADSGGAQRIAMTLVNKFGEKNIQWAVVIASFIIGIALFFEVGLVLLIPIVFAISRELKISILFLGIPMVAALSVTHGFLPPHPGPTAIAGEYGANIGEVLLYGFIVAVPTVLIAGPLFTKFAKKIVPASFAKNGNIASLGTQKTFNLEETPGFGISVFTAMLPIIIMSVATIIDLLQETIGFADNGVLAFIRLIGNASTAMIISLLVAVYTMGHQAQHSSQNRDGFLFNCHFTNRHDAFDHRRRRRLQTSADQRRCRRLRSRLIQRNGIIANHSGMAHRSDPAHFSRIGDCCRTKHNRSGHSVIGPF
ncbi:gluconate permease [Bacillus subtilis BEST7003]|nr:gluconate permease [Bacillus subtilis BEST7613]BAM60106.1 gluconate permease [Bacillus subtilis BEST7003]